MQVLAVLSIVFIAASSVRAQNMMALLMNTKYMEKQFACFLDNGDCDGVGNQIKRLLPEVINNNCGRCTAYEALLTSKLVESMYSYYPIQWNSVIRHYTIQ